MKHSKTKKAGKARKATKTAAVATAPKAAKSRLRDPRIPAAGTVLTRTYKGKELRVTVLDDGFRYDGKEFRSLTAIALAITGYPACSGPAWFGLAERRTATPKATAAKSPKSKRAAVPPTEGTAAEPAPSVVTPMT